MEVRPSTMPKLVLPKAYSPKGIEEKWYRYWESQGYFYADANDERPSYCITIPPPNVTGSLHMGHALNHTIHDIVVRWQRMLGKTFFVCREQTMQG